MVSAQYDFALQKLPWGDEPFSDYSKRDNFYKICMKYKFKFNKPPPQELFETLWTQANKS